MSANRAFLPLVLVILVSFTSLTAGGQQILPQHPTGACSAPYHIQHAGWDVCWQQDDIRGQGVELNQAYFQDKLAIWKIGFPFSLTEYENNAFGPYKDTLGQSIFGGENPGFGRGALQIDIRNCPRFLGHGSLMNDDRLCIETRDGPEPAVAVWGRYDIFNYRFIQGYTLDSRGIIEPFIRLGGLLTDGDEFTGGARATNHFHHVFWRVDMDISETGNDGIQMYVRPHGDVRQWDPVTVVSSNSSQDPRCLRFQDSQGPTWCREQGAGDGNLTVIDPLADMPETCRHQVRNGTAGWCDIVEEAALVGYPALATKWRTRDAVDTNKWGNARSFESTGHTHVDTPPSGDYTTFDVLALQYAGDSQEIGYNVPPFPVDGDTYLHDYLDPGQVIDDPVMWFTGHVYHDTRDEEVPTMSYHHISFEIQPRDFLGSNPGEDSYSSSPLITPPGGIEPEPCMGPVCI